MDIKRKARGQCSVAGCGRDSFVKGYCQTHYKRWRRYGDPTLTAQKVRASKKTECSIEGCENKVVARSLCRKHYKRLIVHGTAYIVTEQERTEGSSCQVDGCGREKRTSGLCSMHYSRLCKRGDVGGAEPENSRKPKTERCKVDGCNKVHVARGFCLAHYKSWRKKNNKGKPCSVDGCDRAVEAKGFCSKHYERWRRHGDVTHGRVIDPIGTRKENASGYVKVKVGPDDPHADIGGWAPEHRVIMARALARPLRPEENVHHINGVKSDNRPENLELWNVSQPPGQRPQDLLEYARYIIDLYGPD